MLNFCIRTANVSGFTLLIATIGWGNKKPLSWKVSNQMLDPYVSHMETLMYPMLSVSVSIPLRYLVFDSQALLDHGEEVAQQCHQWLLEMNLSIASNV